MHSAKPHNKDDKANPALTPFQRGLWASQLRFPEVPLQNMATLTHIGGEIDAKRFQAAFLTVVDACDVLRTIIKDGVDAVVVVSEEAPGTTGVLSVERGEVTAWANERIAKPINMEVCGYDSVLLQHEDGTATWFLNIHHCITDAVASSLVITETAAAYAGERVEAQSFYDWVAETFSHDERTADKATRRALEYWKNRPATPKPGNYYKNDDRRMAQASRVELQLTRKLRNKAVSMVRGEFKVLNDTLSWSCLWVCAAAIYMYKLTGSRSLSIGLPLHNRSTPQTRALAGPTLEIFPVDVVIQEGDSHRELHKRVGQSVFNTLKKALPGTAPGSDFDFVVNNIPEHAAPPEFAGMTSRVDWLNTRAIDPAQAFRLHMSPYQSSRGESGQGFSLAIDVGHSAAGPEHLKYVAGHFTGILEEFCNRPDEAIDSFSLCTKNETVLLKKWEFAPRSPKKYIPVAKQLRAVLEKNGAVVLNDGSGDGGDERLTGAELFAWAASLANQLLAAGMSPGARVGVALNPTIEAVVAIYGVLLAGASFVPLDPGQPQVRRTRLSQRAGLFRVFSTAASVHRSRPKKNTAIVDGEFDKLPGLKARPTDEAYLLFTSGSTGEPKGVPVTHRGLANYLDFAGSSYFANAGKPIAPLFGSLTFDLTITSLFCPILAGGELITMDGGGALAMTKIAENKAINWCKATPSHLEILTRLLPSGHGLKTLVVGGEAFGSQLADRLLSFKPGMAVFNEYGPTEAVVGCMIHKVGGGDRKSGNDVPIGRPAAGVSLLVVDGSDNRVPIGAAGELLISHAGLTSGYLRDNPELAVVDDASFVKIGGKRYYRSGDLVRLQTPESAIYLGRKDEQIKVGGIRLNPLEVEEALIGHPLVDQAVVRQWSPTGKKPKNHCSRCGLPDNVPGTEFDSAGVCNTCHAYERVAPLVQSWFRTPTEFEERVRSAAKRNKSEYDCIHLLSGGKDSTYVLYQLVEMGLKPYVLTLDNGFISESAKNNCRRVVEELGTPHEFMTTSVMNAIFQDSLATFSNVCQGCFKTIYTLATNKAVELDISSIVTGLSRGQLFETRLIPHQFSEDRFDPEAIDQTVLKARKAYHRVNDAPRRLLPSGVFDNDSIFDQIEYVDFYRYFDVELSDVLDYLALRTPWLRPEDTGRSTNCLVNVAGIYTHLEEQGFHNYAVPYAWDVRLGHKQRDEAMAEINDNPQFRDVSDMLGDIAYQPKMQNILTAWVRLSRNAIETPSPAEFRSHLGSLLPRHAIPASFCVIEEVPVTSNGKLDEARLPAPERVHRATTDVTLAAQTETETRIIDIWERLLKLEPIGVDDDFFALGGDSLAALEMIVEVSEGLDLSLAEESAFIQTTPRALADSIDRLRLPGSSQAASAEPVLAPARPAGTPPGFSIGEMTILFDQQSRPDSVFYNVGRIFKVAGEVAAGQFRDALETVLQSHEPLIWNYASPRKQLSIDQALFFQCNGETVARDELNSIVRKIHREPFDLSDGPLMRCLIQPVEGATTYVIFAIHHVSGDHESFDRLWSQINDVLEGGGPQPLGTGYGDYCRWQEQQLTEANAQFWLENPPPNSLAEFSSSECLDDEADGFLTKRIGIRPQEFSRTGRSTPVGKALAAMVASIAPCFDGSQIPFALVASSRMDETAKPLFGYFLNPLPMSLEFVATRSFEQLAFEATMAVGRAMPHRAYPLSRIVRDRRAAGVDVPPLNILLAYDSSIPTELEGKPVSQEVAFNGDAVADLTFFVEVREDVVDLSVEYSGKRIGKHAAFNLLTRFAAAIERTVREPASRLGSLEGVGAIASDSEEIAGSTVIGEPVSDETLVIERVLAHIENRPDSAAVVCGGEKLLWGDLGKRSRAFAHALQTNGIGRGDHVVLCAERNALLVAAVVGIHLTGAAYVPIDPTYPENRQKLIADAADAKAWIGDSSTGVTTETFIGIGDDLPSAPVGIQFRLPEPSAAAYVIFTSGSTGAPGGVAVSHYQLALSTNGRRQIYAGAPERFLLLSSFAFDSSIVGLFWTLAAGNTIVMPTEKQAHDVDGLILLMSEWRVSHLLCVPTIYSALLARREFVGSGSWPEQVIVAGESCPPALIRQHFDSVSQSRLTNEYGPTEATVWSSAYHCTGTESEVPIGKPAPGTWSTVVDGNGHICKQGQVGELIIGGFGVTAGYVNDPDRTGQRFFEITDDGMEELPVGRYFKTGDRACVKGGMIYFRGRSDNQLNIGGSRFEPGDIENTLLKARFVTAAVVSVSDSRSLDELTREAGADQLSEAMKVAGQSDDPLESLTNSLRAQVGGASQIVAHVEAGEEFDVDVLKRLAAEQLPTAVQPRKFIRHENLPRTPNGKVDREAVAAMPLEAPVNVTQKPTVDEASPAQDVSEFDLERLTELFRKVLKEPTFTATDSFFDFGGHSLQVVNLLLTIEGEFGLQLSTSDIYSAPTPRALAALIRVPTNLVAAPEEPKSRILVVPIQPEGSKPPLFAIHNLGDDCQHFRPLAKELGKEQPLYGLGYPQQLNLLKVAEDDPTALYDVRDIARSYVEEIERIAPSGPIYLIGLCGGAVVGYEVGLQLSARGRAPDNMIMISDWHAPFLDLDQVPAWKAKLSLVLDQTRRRRLEYMKDLAGRIPGIVGRQFDVLKRRIEIRHLRHAHARRKPLSKRLLTRQYIEQSFVSLHSYNYVPYAAPVTIIRGNDDPRFPADLDYTGWGELLAEASYLRSPGISNNMMQKPNVEHLAFDIREVLGTGIVPKAETVPDHPVATLVNDNPGTQEEGPPSARRIRRSENYEISLKLFDDSFLDTPRVEQRNWILNQAVAELAAALDSRNDRVADMIRGGDPTELDGRAEALLSAEEIMEDWQGPVMQAMTDNVCENGADILEVGFGRGVSSDMIQAHQVGSHTIIECNSHIIADCQDWAAGHAPSDIRIVEGLWEDTVDGLGKFDGIFFHTYPLDQDELLDNLTRYSTFAEPFFPAAVKLMKPGGKFSYYTNEGHSLSRAHQEALLRHFASFKISQVRNLEIPQTSHDAHWYRNMVVIEVIGH